MSSIQKMVVEVPAGWPYTTSLTQTVEITRVKLQMQSLLMFTFSFLKVSAKMTHILNTQWSITLINYYYITGCQKLFRLIYTFLSTLQGSLFYLLSFFNVRPDIISIFFQSPRMSFYLFHRSLRILVFSFKYNCIQKKKNINNWKHTKFYEIVLKHEITFGQSISYISLIL